MLCENVVLLLEEYMDLNWCECEEIVVLKFV